MTVPKRVALVHDYLLVMRGAERTFAEIASFQPRAPIYTLLYDPVGTDARFERRVVHTSYLQRLRIRQTGFRHLLPFFPRAAESLPVRGHDLIISSSSAFAHGVQAEDSAAHLCYCHSPFRYAWHERDRALQESPRLLRPPLRRTLRRIRDWDLRAARAVTAYVANSALTRERIRDFYGRDAAIVHPPVEVERFQTATPEEFFLVVTELVPHKRTELALEAARRAGFPVMIVGDGPDRRRLEWIYGPSATFLGRLGDEELAALYPRARAVVVPNVEEFGIVAVEAQAAGRPVVAADAGGARETVINGETGVLFPPGDVDQLAEAMRHTDFDRFQPSTLVEHAARFSPTQFRKRFLAEASRLA